MSCVMVVMLSVDDIFFLTGIRVGDRVILRACVNRSFGHSVEVGCRVERMGLSGTVEHALTGFVTFECMDGTAIPHSLEPETEDEKKRFLDAMGRRKIRLSRKILRSHSASLACAWNKANASELVYANIRGLMMFSNRQQFGVSFAGLGHALTDPTKSASEPQWEVLFRLPAEPAHLTLSMKQTKDLVTCVRLDAPLRGTPKQVFDFLVDLQTRELWDVVFSNATCVEKIDDRNDIIHFRTRPPAPAQDFVLLRSWRSLITASYGSHNQHHQEFVISNRSVIHDKVPPIKGTVRAEVLSSGFLLQPLKLAQMRRNNTVTGSGTSKSGAGLVAQNSKAFQLPPSAAAAAGSGGSGGSTSTGDEAWTHVAYVVQLGTKALALVSGDLVGEQSQSIVKSFANLQRVCMERFGGTTTSASGSGGSSLLSAPPTLPPVAPPAGAAKK